MISLKIYGDTCQIKSDFFPCIHTCSITIDNVKLDLTDFINNCNTVPEIIYKQGHYEQNNAGKDKILVEHILEDNYDLDYFLFYIYNIDKASNMLALKNIQYKDSILQNVLHT